MLHLQVALADFALLADVLKEIRGIIELGSNWSNLVGENNTVDTLKIH
jgi:hypothetical protein